MSTTFRLILRDATHASHQRVDDLLSGLDLREREGFAQFAAIHLRCFEAMLIDRLPGDNVHDMLRGFADALRADLLFLGVRVDGFGPNERVTDCDCLAMRYIVGGSRLGTNILRKHWAAAQDPVVRGAANYFSLKPEPKFWRKTCDALCQIDPGSPRADRIVRDTQQLYALFERAFDAPAPHFHPDEIVL